jgi:signal transduction histidine kinase
VPSNCDDARVADLTRFNESIDQSLAKAVTSYTQKVTQSRNLFLAILSHDLRNPLNSIAMTASLLPHVMKLDPESTEMTSLNSVNVTVMAWRIGDLLDYTRTRLGARMPVKPEPMDAGELCRALYNEFRSAHPKRAFHYDATGDLTGEWDADRQSEADSATAAARRAGVAAAGWSHTWTAFKTACRKAGKRVRAVAL